MDNMADNEIMKIFECYLSPKAKIWPTFTLENLVGKTISNHKKIKNPKPYNPKIESPNPEYFNVLEFSDGSILLFKAWGDTECVHLSSYLYESRDKKIYYNDNLLGSI